MATLLIYTIRFQKIECRICIFSRINVHLLHCNKIIHLKSYCMKKTLLLVTMLCASLFAMADVTTSPAVIPLDYDGQIVITFDPTGTDMAGKTNCYAYTGVTTTEEGAWQCAPEWGTTAWGADHAKYLCTKSGSKWVFTISSLKDFYTCAAGQNMTAINILFRTADGKSQTGDITLPFNFEEKEPTVKARPSGITEGIFYDATDASKVTVSLYIAPSKSGVTAKNVYIYCDANNWTASNDYQCYKDGNYFWYTFTGLTPGKEYAYQYAIKKSDGVFTLSSDPYSTKVLHPDDKWEPKQQDPTLMDYPKGAIGYVTVLQPGKEAFKWSNATLNFKRPNKDNLVIYELWVNSFSKQRNYKEILNRLDYIENLGVNAIEFMPLCEFEGNLSWGYAPNHYFALDKVYGPENDLKELIDECHKRGIAVILDMVYNHTNGQHPFEMIYGGYAGISDNPYYNDKQHLPQGQVDDCFNDISHVDYVRDHLTAALNYWLEEFKFDGFRMDLSHGFCTTNCNGRQALMKHYYEKGVKAVHKDGYFILEHWHEQNGEKNNYVNQGMMCWENTNEAYGQVAMNYLSASDKKDDLSRANRDGYVSYVTSHDEQRPFWKAKTYSAAIIKNDETLRLNRVPAVTAMCVMLNGPQMIYQFDELGYDFSFCSNAAATSGNNKDKGSSPCHDTDSKPLPESYGWFQNDLRMNAYQKIAQIIQLRTKLAPKTFEGNPTSSDLSAGKALRSVIWGSGNSRIFVLANFGTTAQSYTLPTGNNWYDYLAGSTQVLSGGKSMSIAGGDVKVFTASKYDLPNVPNRYDYVGIGELEEAPKATIYPSVTSDFVTIDAEEEISDVKLVALSGQTYSPNYTEDGLVDVRAFDAGLYLLVVRFQSYETAFKIIVTD